MDRYLLGRNESFSDRCGEHQVMHSGDILGDEGRKALDACVKVKIIGRPETRRYRHFTVEKRLKNCYAGNYPDKSRPFKKYGPVRKEPWLDVHRLLFPFESISANYDIIDIHDALVRFDEIRYVEKYPVERAGCHELKDLIDKRRADVERECEKATANPDGRHRYSWLVAQRRVRDCFAGNFAGDAPLLEMNSYGYHDTYTITDIHDAFVQYDDMNFVNNCRENKFTCNSCSSCKEAEKQRADLDREYTEATSSAGTAIKQGHQKYSQHEVEQRVRDCVQHVCSDHSFKRVRADRFLIEEDEKRKANLYDIFDICKTICRIDRNNIFKKLSCSSDKFVRPGSALFEKYPSDGPGTDELKKLIDKHRADLEKEYQEDKLKEYKYSRNEAERRVRDCFAGSFISNDTDIFCNEGHGIYKSKISQTYDIFDIQKAIKYFDSKKLVEKYPEEEGPDSDKQRKSVDERRADIKREYDEATTSVEIEHGSGFIIEEHLIITNKHVIESALDDETKKTRKTQIFISNAAIGDHGLPCEVAHYDVGKDLALLYCKDLNLDGICPLKLSNQSLLPGMQIFSFGFPISHTQETALFVNGYVSGSKKMLSGHTMAVLNCSLNCGNSGGPVLCWVKGQLRVVGVATQKHFKEILTVSQRETIEKMREMLQTSVIPELPEFEKSVQECYNIHPGELPRFGKTSMFLLTLKLYDALETHSQFNLSNALPGDLVIQFVKNCLENYNGDFKDELTGIVKKLSEDP